MECRIDWCFEFLGAPEYPLISAVEVIFSSRLMQHLLLESLLPVFALSRSNTEVANASAICF